MKPTSRPDDEAAAANITKRIKELGDWRGETLAHVRQLIHDADPDIQEEWKWVKPTNPGTPVWSRDGIVCTGESYKEVVKLTFARGAALKDPKKLFNSSQWPLLRRAIDLREGEKINEAAFKQLIRAAVAANSQDINGRRKTGQSLRPRLPMRQIYCSSVTCSIQSTTLPSSCSWIAMCVMAVVGAAPCQCFSPGGNQTTSPGRISSIGPPQR